MNEPKTYRWEDASQALEFLESESITYSFKTYEFIIPKTTLSDQASSAIAYLQNEYDF